MQVLTGRAAETAEKIEKATDESGIKDAELTEDEALTLFMVNHAFPKDEIFRGLTGVFVRLYSESVGNKEKLLRITAALRIASIQNLKETPSEQA